VDFPPIGWNLNVNLQLVGNGIVRPIIIVGKENSSLKDNLNRSMSDFF